MMSEQREVILVTGSSGLIGYPVAKRLAEQFTVVGFDRAGPPHPPPTAECVTVDLTSDESVATALHDVRTRHGSRLASVIHLAAYYDFSGAPSPNYETITVQGTERLLRHLDDFEVEQFVFSSTMLLHEPSRPGQKINEDSPVRPTWPYPESKVRTEELIREKRGRIPAVILRIAGVFDEKTHSIPLAHQMQRVVERQLLSRFFPGDPDHGQAFVHLEDVVDAIVRAVHRRSQLPDETTILIGEPDTVSYDELQRIFGLQLHGIPWRTFQIPKPMAKAGAWLQQQLPIAKETFIKPWMIDRADDHYELDITRARTLLGWEPKHAIADSIPEMVAFLRRDPAAWYRENDLQPPRKLRKEEPMPEEQPIKTHGEMMQPEEHHGMMREHHQKFLWAYLTNVILGCWLLSAPLTFSARLGMDAWNDVASGVLLIVFGLLSLNPMRMWAPWGSCFVGIWLLFAPLIFWTPSAAIYASDTIVGALAIALSVLIPGMPGMMPMRGAEIPPGWTYNPSSWLQRTPMIALAFVGFFLSRYLAAYQLRHIGTAWDPFFGDGTVRVLDSEVSKAWPISDAGLGSLSYMLEALSGFMGDRVRWRTMPWMVLMFFFLVVPLGVTSIVLVIMQPVMVGAWCTICLVTAVAMLIMIPLTLDEVIAMTQFMLAARRQRKPLWKIFWMGGTIEEEPNDRRTPAFDAPFADRLKAMWWGVTVPWNLPVSALVGLWLMFAPAVLGNADRAADSDHLIGALIITFAVIAMAEVARPARLLNVAFGLWLIVAPWIVAGASPIGRWNDVAAGVLAIALSLRRGPVSERYASWDRFI